MMKGFVALAVSSMIAITPYGFDDALRNGAPSGQGFKLAQEFASFIYSTQSEVKIDPINQNDLKTFGNSLKRFDISEIYNSEYAQEIDKDCHGVRLNLMARNDCFLIYLLKNNPPEMSQLWDSTVDLGFKKNKSAITQGKSFITSSHIKMVAKNYSHNNIIMLSEGFMKVIDPDNIKRFKVTDGPSFNMLNEESLKVTDSFSKTYPNLLKLLMTYTSHPSFVEIKEYNKIPYTHFNYRLSRRLDNLEKDFPEMVKYIKKREGLYTINQTFKNKKNHTLMTVVFSTHTDVFLNASFYTRQGRVIPMDSNGLPVFDEEISLTEIKDITYFSVIDLKLNMPGIQAMTSNIVFRNDYHQSPEGASLRIRLMDIPKTRIVGTTLPKWLVDMNAPDFLTDYLINDFTKVLVHANNGEGTTIKLEWDCSDTGDTIFQAHAATEFLDNYIVKFILKVRKFFQRNNEKLAKESKEFRKKIIVAFKNDVSTSR